MARTITPTESHDWSVYIGRFQPFHLGHLALLQRALSLAPRCVVVLGSAHQARTPKNPWTWQERAEMIRLALSAADRDRVQFQHGLTAAFCAATAIADEPEAANRALSPGWISAEVRLTTRKCGLPSIGFW